jgi:hypothetical protein
LRGISRNRGAFAAARAKTSAAFSAKDASLPQETPVMTDTTKISAAEAAVAAVAHDPNLIRLRDEALAEGHVDELCGRCGTLLMAHHHFLRCDLDACPMKSKDGKSLLDMLEAMP